MVSRATFAYRVTRVDEEAAANAVYANGVILHLDHRTIPESFPVSNLIQTVYPIQCLSGANKYLQGVSLIRSGFALCTILSMRFLLYSLIEIIHANSLLTGWVYSGLPNPKLGCVYCFGFVVFWFWFLF